ncbi:unnamed protein product [Closterium sp. Yama58-4]|nr:unnamed protein product [Closterium sp. Yama58-4]
MSAPPTGGTFRYPRASPPIASFAPLPPPSPTADSSSSMPVLDLGDILKMIRDLIDALPAALCHRIFLLLLERPCTATPPHSAGGRYYCRALTAAQRAETKASKANAEGSDGGGASATRRAEANASGSNAGDGTNDARSAETCASSNGKSSYSRGVDEGKGSAGESDNEEEEERVVFVKAGVSPCWLHAHNARVFGSSWPLLCCALASKRLLSHVASFSSLQSLTLENVDPRGISLKALAAISPQLHEFLFCEPWKLEEEGGDDCKGPVLLALEFPRARRLSFRFLTHELKLKLALSHHSLTSFSACAQSLTLACRSARPLALTQLLLFGEERIHIASFNVASVRALYLNAPIELLPPQPSAWADWLRALAPTVELLIARHDIDLGACRFPWPRLQSLGIVVASNYDVVNPVRGEMAVEDVKRADGDEIIEWTRAQRRKEQAEARETEWRMRNQGLTRACDAVTQAYFLSLVHPSEHQRSESASYVLPDPPRHTSRPAGRSQGEVSLPGAVLRCEAHVRAEGFASSAVPSLSGASPESSVLRLALDIFFPAMATGSLKQIAKCRLRDLLVASTAGRTFASAPSAVQPAVGLSPADSAGHHARADSAARTQFAAGTTDSLRPAASQPTSQLTSQPTSQRFPDGCFQPAFLPRGRWQPALPSPPSALTASARSHAPCMPHTLWPAAPRAESATAAAPAEAAAAGAAAARCHHSAAEPCHHDEARTGNATATTGSSGGRDRPVESATPATSAADGASACWLCSADRVADARAGGKGNPSADDMHADAEAEGARGRGDGASKEGDPLTWRFFCGTCGALQPVDKHTDLFELFGLPRAFAIDLSLLEQRYKQLQKMLHPDLHGGRSEEERALSAEQAAHVIDAYYTLLRPLSRAKYLLRASGVTPADLSGDSPGRDQQLLMEVMELRETIEDADSFEELQALQTQTQERMQGLYSSFDEALRRGDVGACVGLLHRMAYFQRVANEIDNRLHSM